MKKFLIAAAALAAGIFTMSAQDMAVATETFNKAATILNSEDGNRAEALKLFQEALAQGEACGDEGTELVANCKNIIPDLALSIAKTQLKAGSYDEAIAALGNASELAGKYGSEKVASEAAELLPNAYVAKGQNLIKAKDFAAAKDVLAEAVALAPTDGNANFLLGTALVQTGDTEGAIAALKVAAENGKEAQAGKALGSTYLKQGVALLKAGKNAEAVEAFETSNTYAPSAQAYKMLANTYNKLSKKTEAIEAAKKYLELDPNAKDAATYKQLIEVLSK